MKTPLTDQVREAGYETLFLLGGFLALSVHPTQRNLDDIIRWVDETQARRLFLRRLEQRGLIESATHKGQWVPVLTDLGRAAFAGGRHPERAWNRAWDKQWRLLTFDLPRKQHPARMKLHRWLCRHHFGRLQGSVWISPDPVPEIGELIAEHQIEPTNMMIFEGTPAGDLGPREVAATAWDFTAIDAAYRDYAKFAAQVLRNLQKTTPSGSRLQSILRDDRKRWWEAVRRDPLLPKPLHPKGYEGPRTWKVRSGLLRKLSKARGHATSP